MMRFARASVIAATLFFLTGCHTPTERESLVNQEQRESIAGKTTTDVVTSAKTTPPDITITTTDKAGTTVEVKQPVQQETTTAASTEASETADAKASGSAKDSETIPLGTKLILLSIGLALLGIIFWLVLRSSSAVRAAWHTGDEFLTRAINRVRTMAQAETDPSKANLLNTVTSAMESERAEFNRD